MVPKKGKLAPSKANGKPIKQTKSYSTKQGAVVKKEKETVEIKKSTLTFPLLKTVDNDRLMPQYTSIVNRSEEEGVQFEELDILKIELQRLLPNVAVRVWILQSKLKNLPNAIEDKKIKKSQNLDKAPASPAKHEKHVETTIKKVKETPVTRRDPMCPPPSINITKVKRKAVPDPISPSAPASPAKREKHVETTIKKVKETPVTRHELMCPSPSIKTTEVECEEVTDPVSPSEVLPLDPMKYKPSNYWQSVNEYCRDITSMDIKFLEENIKCREIAADLHSVPPLGGYYARGWAIKDIKTKQKASSSVTDRRPGTSNIVGKKVIPKPTTEVNEPLTQRLVSTLTDDNVFNSKGKIDPPVCKGKGTRLSTISDGENVTALKVDETIYIDSTIGNVKKLLTQELEEQDVKDKNNQTKDPPEQEIMKDMLKLQLEIDAITAHNCRLLKKTLHKAREQLPKQQLKRKLKTVEKKIQDVHRKFASAKRNKIIPSKTEREIAWRVLKERDNLIRQLDSFPEKSIREIIRPQETQVRPSPEKESVPKPPMGYGAVDKPSLTTPDKQAPETPVSKSKRQRKPTEKYSPLKAAHGKTKQTPKRARRKIQFFESSP